MPAKRAGCPHDAAGKKQQSGEPLLWRPPVKSNNLESRCFGALFDLTSASADADRGIWRDEIHIAIPDPALSRIFHPPR
jgi:hypothetical protein